MSAAPALEEAAALLRVLGHGVRLRLLDAMAEAERSVGDLEALTGTGQPMLSQQLGVLRHAGLVRTRRAAKQVFYRLDRERMREITALIERFAGGPPAPEGEAVRPRPQPGGSAAMFARIG